MAKTARMTDPRSSNPIDHYVGRRMKQRRDQLRMSQEKLGELLGISFQQVQKYERGLNRVSASRLFEVARVMGVAVDYFFDGLEGQSEEGETAEKPLALATLMSIPGALDVLGHYAEITTSSRRRMVLDLARLMTAEEAAETEAAH